MAKLKPETHYSLWWNMGNQNKYHKDTNGDRGSAAVSSVGRCPMWEWDGIKR